MARLMQTNPGLFSNPTLGAAAPNRFLEEVEAQLSENIAARREGRVPRIAEREIRYPTMAPSGSVPSTVAPVVKFVPLEESTPVGVGVVYGLTINEEDSSFTEPAPEVYE